MTNIRDNEDNRNRPKRNPEELLDVDVLNVKKLKNNMENFI